MSLLVLLIVDTTRLRLGFAPPVLTEKRSLAFFVLGFFFCAVKVGFHGVVPSYSPELFAGD